MLHHNCAMEDRKLPIDRPCSACSAGDYKMEHHDHCPPFRASSKLEPTAWPRCECGGVATTNASDDITRTCIRCGGIVQLLASSNVHPKNCAMPHCPCGGQGGLVIGVTINSSANAHQVGGEHYRALNAELQHWDLVALTGMGYFEGQITRYLARWRRKNGAEDVAKAMHYTDKLTELVSAERYLYRVSCTAAGWAAFKRFVAEQRLTRTEELAFEICINWTTTRDLERLRRLIAEISNAPKVSL